MEMQPFYVGQEVIGIKDHSQGYIKKGEHYTISGIMSGCKCTKNVVTVAEIAGNNRFSGCNHCNHFFSETGIWLSEKLFAPIQTEFQSVTFERVLETELFSAN